jgi:hypothetical protein
MLSTVPFCRPAANEIDESEKEERLKLRHVLSELMLIEHSHSVKSTIEFIQELLAFKDCHLNVASNRRF